MHTLRCFGRVCVEGPSGESVRLRSSKHLALLVYLTANPDHEHPRDRLAWLLWETDRPQARHSLSQALYDIRCNLPRLRVRASVNHVAVERGSIDSELDSFEEAVRGSDVATAVELYRGSFVPDLESVATPGFERWVEDERQRLQRLAELALSRYVTECDDRARWGEVCTVALRLLDMNPLHEEAHRAFMRGMWLQGDQQAALDHFRQIEPVLAAELPEGVAPETRRLVERIRSSRPDLRRPEPGRPERPPMVGRRREFGRLKDRLRRLEGGRGGVVVLRGEAGIGKTRLLEETRELARLHGITTLESRCFAAEADVSYGPVVEGLLPVASEHTCRSNGDSPTFFQLGLLFPDHFTRPRPGDEEVEADAGRRRLYEETAVLLKRACEERPRLWIVEDLHWADASSASLIHYVSRRLRDHPLLVLASVRSGERLDEAATPLLEAWCGQREADCVELEGLSDEETAELIESLRPGSLDDKQLHFIGRLASGNPFFAIEMVSAAADLQEWCPDAGSSRHLLTESLEALLGVRLKGLSPESVHLLETVAVLERHATPFLASRTSGLSAARVAELARTLYSRGLLRDLDERLEFGHDLTREYVYGNMGELQRAALHLVSGEVLAGSGVGVSPSTLARHFELGGDRPRAYEYALRAAEVSATAYAHDEAIALSQLAASQTVTREERAAALRILAEAESASGSLAAAESHLKELIDLSVHQPEETIAIKLKIARARVELSQFRSAEAILDELQVDLNGLPSPARQSLQAEAHHWRLKSSMMLGDTSTTDRTVALIKTEIPTLERLESKTGEAVALYSLAGHALFASSVEVASQYCEHAIRALGDADHELALRMKTLHGAILTRAMQWEEAEQVLRSALAEATELNDVRRILVLLNNLSCCHLEQGHWDEVEALNSTFGRYAAGLSETLAARADIDLNVANCFFYRGKPRAAEGMLLRTLEIAEGLDAKSLVIDAQATLGLIYAQLGQHGDMMRCYDCISSLAVGDLVSVQDRFKVYWLAAFAGRFGGSNVDFEWEPVLDLERQADRAGYLKLTWLQMLLSGPAGVNLDPSTDSKGRALSRAGLRWFAYFSRRWMAQACRREWVL
jgi:DNA-binding SARP family transcriptional activator/tetratricopeptide (TPR) repeat protein